MAGDYPKLPIEPMYHKDPYYNWDCPEMRRNYGEPLHENHWMYHECRYTPMTNLRYTRTEMHLCQLAFGILMYVLYTIGNGNYYFPTLQRTVCGGSWSPRTVGSVRLAPSTRGWSKGSGILSISPRREDPAQHRNRSLLYTGVTK